MRFKPYLVAGIFTVSVAVAAFHHSAYATSGPGGTDTAIILAQNTSDDGGFFGRLFNRSRDRDNAAKPFFVDRARPSMGIKPYDFNQNRRGIDQRRQRVEFGVDWDAFVKARETRIEQNSAYAAAAVRVIDAEIGKMLDDRRAGYLTADAGGVSAAGNSGVEKAKKKMVYNPAKAWSYDPNKSKEEQTKQAPRLYNSQQ